MTAPYWSNGVATLYHADARDIPLPDASVHTCICSPPYWSLRDYGLAGWEGGDPECDHIRPRRDIQSKYETSVPAGWGTENWYPWPDGVCGKCGARQEASGIGLEPTLDDWIANIVAVMREVRRVLRDDGTLWLNLGDAFVGSRKGMNADGTHSPGHKQATNHGTQHLSVVRGKRVERGEGSGRWGLGDAAVPGLQAKNLMFQPHRIALALQQPWLTCRECEATHHQSAYGRWPDGRLICPTCWESAGVALESPGWIVRQTNHWVKPNPMPESADDRTTSAVEYVFHCVKTNRPLYWTYEDGRMATRAPMPDYYWQHEDTGDTRDRPTRRVDDEKQDGLAARQPLAFPLLLLRRRGRARACW